MGCCDEPIDDCFDSSRPTTDESSGGCDELVPSDCVTASEGSPYFGYPVDATLTEVLRKIRVKTITIQKKIDKNIDAVSSTHLGKTLVVSSATLTQIPMREDFSKPFPSLTQANLAAQSGDMVVVYPGIYEEDNVILPGVNYYFQPGAVVSSENEAILVDSIETVSIYGHGIFVSSNSIVANIQNSNEIHFYAKSLIGRNGCIKLDKPSGTTRLFSHIEKVTADYGTILETAGGFSLQGYAKFDIVDGDRLTGDGYLEEINTGNYKETFLFNSQTTSEHEFSLSVNRMFSYTYGETLGPKRGGLTLNTEGMSLDFRVANYSHNLPIVDTNTSAILVKTGRLALRGVVRTNFCYGLIVNTSTGEAYTTIIDSLISSPLWVIESLSDDSYIDVINSQLITRRTGGGNGTVSLGGTTEITFKGSTVVNRGAVSTLFPIYAIVLFTGTAKIRVDNLTVYMSSVIAGSRSLQRGAVGNYYVHSTFSSNFAVDPLLTNAVTGSLVIIDSDIDINPKLFGE